MGRKRFFESWEEGLDSIIRLHETMAYACPVNNNEKLSTNPVILSGDAFIYYSSHVQGCLIYDEAVRAFYNLYNNSDKLARIFTKWQSLCFTEEVSKDLDASDIEVFRKFVAELMSLQDQLDQRHHDGKFLRDRLTTAVDIPSIQIALRDRITCTAQLQANRTENRLFDILRTTAFIMVHHASSK